MAGAKRLSSDPDAIAGLLGQKISCLEGVTCCIDFQLTIDTGTTIDFV
jgi:hypothetical protein